MSDKINLELTPNSFNTVTVQLPNLGEEKLRRLGALERPLNKDHTDFISGGYLPDSFALFEHDANLILEGKIPNELLGWYMGNEKSAQMKEAKARFDKYIKGTESLDTYLRYCKAAFFIEGSVLLSCIFNTIATEKSISIAISNPRNACFVTEKEEEFLRQFLRDDRGYIQDFPVIIDPLQIARKDRKLNLDGITISNIPHPFTGSFPVQDSASGVIIRNGTVIFSEWDKISRLYLVPLQKGNEEVTVTYNCAGQPQTTGKITINVV